MDNSLYRTPAQAVRLFVFGISGRRKDLDGYCPRWLAKSFLFSGKPTIGGVITKGDSGVRGLVLVMPNTIQECIKDKSLCLDITRRLDRIAELIGASAIAIDSLNEGGKNNEPL